MEKIYVATQSISPAIYPGRVLLIRGVSQSRPVPESITAFAKPFHGEVVDPFIFDLEAEAREAAEAHARFNAPPPPDLRLEDVMRIVGTDAAGIELLEARFSMPKHENEVTRK